MNNNSNNIGFHETQKNYKNTHYDARIMNDYWYGYDYNNKAKFNNDSEFNFEHAQNYNNSNVKNDWNNNGYFYTWHRPCFY